MSSRVHKHKPARTFSKAYANYGAYKPYLRDDFNRRCGYCDGLDLYSGGSRGFQIDHFKPKKLFAGLSTEYANLVYSCPFCNRAKWDKWKSSDGFIDPCDERYDECLYRNEKGQIKYKNSQGQYIYDNLNLHLRRHELIWIIEKLKVQRAQLDELLITLGVGHEQELMILRQFREIQQKINKYSDIFYEEI